LSGSNSIKKLLKNLHSACLPAQSLEVFAFKKNMKTKVKFLGCDNLLELESTVNQFLTTINADYLVDIKYSSVLNNEEYYITCLITYIISD
jgi:hypothetical protein